MLNKKILLAIAVPLIAGLLVACVVLPGLSVQDENRLYTYPLSVGDKTYVVTLETNWSAVREPKVALINPSEINRHAIELYFLEGTEKTLTYNITVPTDLLYGNISLVWKYYLQNPERYTLTNNGTHNSLQMTFNYTPPFSGIGYFEIIGTEGAW
ncbi:MAG: hypothetical protein ACQCN3_00975 [Candidatus Bathyarchaeia archaeon]|jgi:hypothetical protein